MPVAAGDLVFDGDPAAAAPAVAELSRMARQYADPSLDCFALTLAGMADVLSGDIGGFAALDEAMIPVLGGAVDPLWGGDIFCSVIHLCEALGDLARMRSWTDSLAEWSGPLSSTFLYAGVTRVHQLQLLRAEGEWDQVERELGDTSAGLGGRPRVAGRRRLLRARRGAPPPGARRGRPRGVRPGQVLRPRPAAGRGGADARRRVGRPKP